MHTDLQLKRAFAHMRSEHKGWTVVSIPGTRPDLRFPDGNRNNPTHIVPASQEWVSAFENAIDYCVERLDAEDWDLTGDSFQFKKQEDAAQFIFIHGL